MAAVVAPAVGQHVQGDAEVGDEALHDHADARGARAVGVRHAAPHGAESHEAQVTCLDLVVRLEAHRARDRAELSRAVVDAHRVDAEWQPVKPVDAAGLGGQRRHIIGVGPHGVLPHAHRSGGDWRLPVGLEDGAGDRGGRLELDGDVLHTTASK